MHPTRERLILTVVELLDGENPDKVQVEEVLTTSGVSRGSLYHHFADFSDLIEAALVYRFSATVDQSIALLASIAVDSNSREEMLRNVAHVTTITQSRDLAPVRAERLRALAMASTSDRFRASLGAEQTRLTDALADLFREAQEKGWFNNEFDPRAAAVLIQAYTLGKAVDDIVDEQIDPESWARLIGRLIERTFG